MCQRSLLCSMAKVQQTNCACRGPNNLEEAGGLQVLVLLWQRDLENARQLPALTRTPRWLTSSLVGVAAICMRDHTECLLWVVG